MKKFRLNVMLLLAAVGLASYAGVNAAQTAPEAVRTLPRTVQGIDYASTLKEVPANVTFIDTPVTPLASTDRNKFTFDMIENWTGEGENRAALVLQWNVEGEKTALVFGYRWSGQASGADMMKAVIEANPRLYGLLQYTNVSSPNDPNGGYTFCGAGWDADEDGDIRLIDTGHDNTQYTSETGFFEHPRGYKPGSGGSPDYDYDDWKAGDADDYWQSGWYSNGYWSYWVGEGETASALSYASYGITGRVLQNNSWDGWSFQPGFSMQNWKEFEPAPQPIPANAKTEFVYNGIQYSLKSYAKKTVVVKPSTIANDPAYSGVVTIPATFVDEGITYTVAGIGDDAFKGTAVTEVKLPETVTAIGVAAFSGSTLAKINLNDNITGIAKKAFYGCPLTEIYFPSKITAITDSAFAKTNIVALTVPEQIIKIGTSAFAQCGQLKTVELSKGLKTIGDSAFEGCDAITSVKAPYLYPMNIPENTFSSSVYAGAKLIIPADTENSYKAATGWKKFVNIETFLTEVTLGQDFTSGNTTYKVTALGDAPEVSINYCHFDGAPTRKTISGANAAGYTGNIEIPQTVTFQNLTFKVTAMNDSCFYGAINIESITLPEGITEIPQHAFDMASSSAGSKLTSVKLPSTVTKIGAYAFQYCSALTTIDLPAGLTSLGQSVFSNCKALTAIELPAGITEIPQYCFNYCKALKNVTINGIISKMGGTCFYECPMLESIDLSKATITELPSSAFGYDKALVDVKLPATLTKIGSSAFQKCTSLTTLEIPAGVTELGGNAFKGCTKLVIDIPANITSIGMAAFADCTSLTKATIPAGAKFSNTQIFSGCTSLKEVTINCDVTTIPYSSFKKCAELTTIKFAQNASKAAVDETLVVLPDDVTTISESAFEGCAALNLSGKMPSKLTKIDKSAFNGVVKLAEIDLPEGFKTFGQDCFKGTSIKEIVVPSTVTSLSGSYLFRGLPEGAKIYITNITPASISSSSMKLTSDTYADITVPSATKEAFVATGNYWKKVTTLKEPELAVTFTPGETTIVDNNVQLATTVAADYAVAVPERFAKANEPQFAKATVKLVYQETTVPDETQPETTADAAAEAVEVEATVTDGKATVDLSTGLKSETEYSYNWVYTLGTTTVSSPAGTFKTKGTTGIDDLTATPAKANVIYADGVLKVNGAEGSTVSVASISGAVVATFDCADNDTELNLGLAAGIYIINIRGNGTCASVKIIVK